MGEVLHAYSSACVFGGSYSHAQASEMFGWMIHSEKCEGVYQNISVVGRAFMIFALKTTHTEIIN